MSDDARASGNAGRKRPYGWDTPTRALGKGVPGLDALPGRARAVRSGEIRRQAPKSFTGAKLKTPGQIANNMRQIERLRANARAWR